MSHSALLRPRGGGRLAPYASVPASSLAPLVTPGASNAKGAWVEIVSSTNAPFPAQGMILTLAPLLSAAAKVCLDIGIGGAGSERVVIADVLMFVSGASTRMGFQLYLPIAIASGTRVAARASHSIAGTANTIRVSAHLVPAVPGGFMGFDRWITYQSDPTVPTLGLNVDAGAVAHTDAAWGVLSASLTAAVRCFYLCVCGAAAQSVNAAALVDVAMSNDDGTTWVEIVSDYPVYADNFTDVITPQILGPFLCDIPAGADIAVRHRCNNTTDASSPRDIDYALVCAG